MSWDNLLIGALVAIVCAASAWHVRGCPLRISGLVCGACAAVMVLGVIVGLPVYPLSDVVVLLFAVTGGVVLGRALRDGLVPIFVLLVVLSVLDVAMNALFTGGPPATPAAPDPHLVWLNFRVPLPTGHFNIGFADLVLIAAMSTHLRARGTGAITAAAPGVIGLRLGWRQGLDPRTLSERSAGRPGGSVSSGPRRCRAEPDRGSRGIPVGGACRHQDRQGSAGGGRRTALPSAVNVGPRAARSHARHHSEAGMIRTIAVPPSSGELIVSSPPRRAARSRKLRSP